MSKKLMCIAVKGKNSVYGFDFYGDPKNLELWKKEGLDIVMLENTVPDLVARLNLVKEWCFLQDIFHLKNPFKDKSETNSIVDE